MTSDASPPDQTAAAFDGLDAAARRAGRSIAAALEAGQTEGRKLEGVLRQLEQRLASLAVESAVRGLGGVLSQTIGGGLSSVLSAAASPLADAAVGKTADDGYAGLAVPAAARAAQPMSVTMNISTPDAESFRRSEAQISAQLARMAQRGQRSL